MDFKEQIKKYLSLLNELLEGSEIAFKDLKPTSLPTDPGIYRIFETPAELSNTIYIGESLNLRKRIYGNHLMGNVRASTLKNKLVKSGLYHDAAAVKTYLQLDCRLQYLIVPAKTDRIRLEHFSVAMLMPQFND